MDKLGNYCINLASFYKTIINSEPYPNHLLKTLRPGGEGVHKGIVINNNMIRQTPGNGIYVACAEDITIENNHVECKQSGIKIEKSSNIEIRANQIVNNCRNIHITGN